MTSEHEVFIQRSLELAQQAVESGNHPFGALLVHDGKVLLEAENTVNTDHDCTRHAELNLVSQASQRFDLDTLKQCTLYTSTEPCAMCSGSIYWAYIPTVVYACSAKTLAEIAGGNLLLACEEVFARGQRPVEVIGSVLEAESVKIHQAFW
jgi:tRNA(Arg) A34 adenosine deaminase TadA